MLFELVVSLLNIHTLYCGRWPAEIPSVAFSSISQLASAKPKPRAIVPLTMEERLMFWAQRTPIGWYAFNAIGDNHKDHAYCNRCLAAIYRYRADADGDWLDFTLMNHLAEFLKLAPLIQAVNGFPLSKAFINARCELLGITTGVETYMRMAA